MTTKKSQESDLHAVELACHAPDAKQVFVAGTFNGWATEATPLQRTRDGKWRTTLKLAPGRYEYKLLVDGRWCCEPGCEDNANAACPECVPNEFGTMNRVVDVG